VDVRSQVSALFHEHLSLAYRVALGVTGSPEDAEDAVQEAFVGLLRSGARIDPASNARAYVARAATNAARQMLRGCFRRQRREEARLPGEGTVPQSTLELREEQAAVRGAMAALDADLRLPLMLRFVEGFSLNEAAETLGLPRSTVDKRTRKALDLLRQALASAGFAAAAPVAVLAVLPRPSVPAALEAATARIGRDTVLSGPSGATGTALKGGLIVKIGLGIATVGLVAGTTFLAIGGRSGEPASPPPATPAAEKVPGKDYPYGEGVVYKRELLFGSSLEDYQDGPGLEMEGHSGTRGIATETGDWFIDDHINRVIRKYDAKKKRIVTVGWRGPFGRLGGSLETMRMGGGGYYADVGTSIERVDPAGKFLIVSDGRSRMRWRLDFEKGVAEPVGGGAVEMKGIVASWPAASGAIYFIEKDSKLKKLLPDGKTVQDLGVTLALAPNVGGDVRLADEENGRLWSMGRATDHTLHYYDMKTGKGAFATGYGEIEKANPYHMASGPADKVTFWCPAGFSFGPDRAKRYVYIGGGDEYTISRLDLEKNYLAKLIKTADGSYTFGEGKGVNIGINWPQMPYWDGMGGFYLAEGSAVWAFRPVAK
jgi:RNA polymerase sigma-70 factor (ECF subfamily)